MSNSFIDIKNASGQPINYNANMNEIVKQPWLNASMDNEKNEVHDFGGVSLSDSEIQQNLLNIGKILEGKESIDFIGSNGMYSYMFNFVEQNKKVLVKYIDPRLDPTEIASSMISDTLVVAELPEEITENIINELSDKKNVIVGTLYKEEELVNDSSFHK